METIGMTMIEMLPTSYEFSIINVGTMKTVIHDLVSGLGRVLDSYVVSDDGSRTDAEPQPRCGISRPPLKKGANRSENLVIGNCGITGCTAFWPGALHRWASCGRNGSLREWGISPTVVCDSSSKIVADYYHRHPTFLLILFILFIANYSLIACNLKAMTKLYKAMRQRITSLVDDSSVSGWRLRRRWSYSSPWGCR